jgi:hypothetical protein
MLSPLDIATDSLSEPSFLSVSLRLSKTDIFAAGHTLVIGATGNTLCPIKVVLSYLAFLPAHPGPPFIHLNGSPLIRSNLVCAVWDALQSAEIDISRHSFRVGAASTAGLLDTFIQTLGHWKSSCPIYGSLGLSWWMLLSNC